MKYYSRYLFDILIFILVNVIGMNVIFGIIIQTFAQLREKLNAKISNMHNVCFICSIDRNEVELAQ